MEVELKSLAQKLNPMCFRALDGAANACLSRGGYEVAIEDLLLNLSEETGHDLGLVLHHYGIELSDLRAALHREVEGFRSDNTGRPVLGAALVDLVRDAWLLASIDFREAEVRSGHLLLTLLKTQRDLSLRQWGNVLSKVPVADLTARFDEVVADSNESAKATGPAAFNANKDSALGRFTTDFTEMAKAGRIDPVFCRDQEIRQMVDVLSRRRKNNPIVVGEAGVGKTAVIEGLALRIVDEDVPEPLVGVSLLGLDLGLLQAGASVKGEFEKRLTQVIKEVKAMGDRVILFIDEAHTLIGSGGAAGTGDAANLLKPELARGEMRSIGATTWSEYKKYFESDPALARRFQLIKLDEPDAESAATIMRGLRTRYEQVHNVYIRDEAIVASAQLSARYISGRQLPDKAIDVLDTACARVAIGLGSRPPQVDDLHRRIQTLERERKALHRDIRTDFQDENHPALNAIDEELASLTERHDELQDRWDQERAIVHRLVELRGELHELDNGDDAEPEGEAKSATDTQPRREQLRGEITQALEELNGVTSDEGLVPYEVTAETVGKVISDWTGVPLGKMVNDETKTLMQFSDLMRERVLGQDQALDLIGQRLRTAKAGLSNPEAPLGVFLLPGPSGVGKTESALAVADLLFGGSQSVTIINMGEFQEKHTVSRLIGSPPGYVGYGEGGVLSEAVRQKPYSVVLLDEVEKGHVDVLNLFYQVFDKGWLADGEGRQIDFRNTVIFLTTNLASDMLHEAAAANPDVELKELNSLIRPVLSKHFRPALLARMEVVPYKPIAGSVLTKIVEFKLRKVAARLQDRYGLELRYGEPLLNYIRVRCTDSASGARNVESVITQHVLPLLAEHMLGKEQDQDEKMAIELDVDENKAITVSQVAA